MRNLRTATSFLTRIPMGIGEVSEERLARSVPWFGVVGAFVGLVVAGVYVGMRSVAPTLLAASVAVMVGVLVTGGFHEDGLADVADALGGHDVAAAQRILKDPTHGTYGVLALVGSVTIRIGALSALDAPSALAAVPAAHALARTAAVGAMVMAPTTQAGLGASYTTSLRVPRALGGLVAGIALAAVAVGPWAAAGIAAAALASLAGTTLARRRFGGINGDVLGAVEQGVEIVLLVLSAVAVSAGWRPWWR